jgi:hypothetical protein
VKNRAFYTEIPLPLRAPEIRPLLCGVTARDVQTLR